MAIEFRCTQCNKLLRTGEGTAGKQAKCPECGTILTVPAAGTAPPAAAPPPAPPPPTPPGGEAGSPLGGPGPGAEAGTPFGGAAAQPTQFDPENPYAAPGEHAPAGPGSMPAPGAFTPTIIDLNDIFSRTWAIFKVQWGMCLAVVVVVGVINFGVNMVVSLVCQGIGAAAGEDAIIIVASLFGNVVTTVFSIWIGIGQSLYFLKVARGQTAEISDIFAGGPWFFSILVASILVGLITLVGFALCIVPGVIFALMFSQFYYLILDRNVGVMDSLNISKEITTGNKLTLFLIGLIEIALAVLGLLACCLGLLAVVPFLTLLAPVTYLVMTGQRTADQILPGGPAAQ